MFFSLRFGIFVAIALLHNTESAFTHRSSNEDGYHVSSYENGRQEIVAVSGRILAIETRRTGKLIARQMTNGQDLLTLIYVGDEKLTACEHLQGHSSELDRFLGQHLNRTSVSHHRALEDGKVKDVEIGKKLFNGSQLDWNRSWYECNRLQETKKEQLGKIGPVKVAATHSSRSRRGVMSLIVPGTTWCGVGNASQSGDVAEGAHVETDRCCRQHDMCQYTIEGFTRKYNLFNFRFHTISHCECDEAFRRCLKMAGDENSNIVGRLFFTILGMKCFVLQPESVCLERAWWGRCIRFGQEPTASVRDSSPY